MSRVAELSEEMCAKVEAYCGAAEAFLDGSAAGEPSLLHDLYSRREELLSAVQLIADEIEKERGAASGQSSEAGAAWLASCDRRMLVAERFQRVDQRILELAQIHIQALGSDIKKGQLARTALGGYAGRPSSQLSGCDCSI